MDAGATTTGTEVPASGGFPPFKTETFPSQIFWLAVTFAALLIVMWRIAVPRIGGTIEGRKAKVAGDLAAAEKHRNAAEAASSAYQQALAEARGRAHGIAEDNRKKLIAEVEKAKADADAAAQAELAKAEARIAEVREQSRAHVANAARDAAADIVARLTGDTISPAEAEAAIAAVRR